MHEKKCSTGKICGIVFFAVTLTVLVFCSAYSAYFSGQQKAVDKFYTAIERQDSKMLSESLLCADGKDDCSEITVQEYNKLSGEYTEDFNVTADFVRRQKSADGGYDYYVNVTVYNDDKHQKYEDVLFHMVLEKGQWRITEYQSLY